MSRLRLTIALSAAALLVTLSALAFNRGTELAPADPAQGSPVPAGSVTEIAPVSADADGQVSPDVWNAANLLEDVAALPFADTFGGKIIPPDNADHLVVYLTQRSPELESEVAAYLKLAPGDLSFRTTPLTWTALTALNDRVTNDLSALAATYPITGTGINADMRVEIAVSQRLSEQQSAELLATYGGGIVFRVDTEKFYTGMESFTADSEK